MAIDETPRMHMGCDLLDLLCGGAKGRMGPPFGSILQIMGDSSSGKAAPLYTKVLTPRGWKPMGDIQVGDVVCTPYRGQNATVLGVYPQGERDIYRIYFNDGTHADTADSHLWVVQTSNLISKPSAFGKGRGAYLVTTKELAELYKEGKPASSHIVGIPTTEPVEYGQAEKPRVPPYLMGLMLADGNLTTSTPCITNIEEDVIEHARQDALVVGLDLRRKSCDDRTYSVVLHDDQPGRSWLPAYIRELGLDSLSTQKHIPECYLRGNVADRIELLHGIFDGDGWLTDQGCCVLTLSSEQLLDDVAELCRSLGLRATKSSPRVAHYRKGDQVVSCSACWNLSIASAGSGICPYSSKKHRQKAFDASAQGHHTGLHGRRRLISAVEFLGKMECQCIYIDHPCHLYLMDDFIVTHNTLLKNEIIARNYHEDPDHFQWFSDDCESGDTFDTEAIWGVDMRPIGKDGYLHIGKKAVMDSTTIEELDAHVSLFLEHLDSCDKGTHGFYVIDSLDGLADATREKDEETRLNQLKKGQEVKDPGSYGAELAKFLSQKFLRLKHHKLKEMQCTLFVISQTREKMNALPFQQKWSVASGKAMEFYCHTRIFLRTIRKIVKEDRVIGAVVSAETMKSKTPRPFRKVVYTVYFDYGIDNIGSNLDYLFDLLTDKGEIDKDKAAAVKWVPGLDFNKDTALTWLKEKGWETLCRKDRQKIEGKNQLSCDWIKQWVFEQGEDPADAAEETESSSNGVKADADTALEDAAVVASTGPTRQERIEAYEKTFGKCYTRDELIEMIDADETRAMAQELTDRVIAKWESIEDSVAVAPHRRPKYGSVKREADEDTVAQSF